MRSECLIGPAPPHVLGPRERIRPLGGGGGVVGVRSPGTDGGCTRAEGTDDGGRAVVRALLAEEALLAASAAGASAPAAGVGEAAKECSVSRARFEAVPARFGEKEPGLGDIDAARHAGRRPEGKVAFEEIGEGVEPSDGQGSS